MEADLALVRHWLGEPVMRVEAAALDSSLPERIEAEARRYERRLAYLQEAVLNALLSPTVPGRH